MLRGTSEGLTGPIDRAGRACSDGLGVLKHLELLACQNRTECQQRKRQREEERWQMGESTTTLTERLAARGKAAHRQREIMNFQFIYQ